MKNNRINVVITIIFLLGALVLYRLYDLQIKKYDLYVALASSQHVAYNKLQPKRGRIFIQDSHGEGKLYPIATNKDFALVYAVPKDIQNPEEVATKLYEIFNKEEVEKEVDELFAQEDRNVMNEKIKILKDLKGEERKEKEKEILDDYNNMINDKDFKELREIKREAEINLRKEKIINGYIKKLSKKNDPYEPIAKKVDEDTLKKVMDLNITGIKFMTETYRFYPEKNIGSHFIGFVGYEGDQKKGFYGLEGFFDEELRGRIGVIKAERDAKRYLTIVSDRQFQKAIDGSDLILTIERPIQFEVCRKLEEAIKKHGADGGSVIVMDPKTGAILAMCSWPDYDPNNYSKEEDPAIFNNPAIFYPYEPGSVFKTITMAAALDKGVITPHSTYEDKGYVNIEGWPKPIKNSDFESHGGWGKVDMTTVLEESLNTGSIYAMNKVGANIFAEYVKRFGFGEKTGIELETEAAGNINNLLRKRIRPIDAAVASFGQGITVTPLQLVVAYAAIANGGILMKPYLVKEIVHPDGQKDITNPKQIRRVISEKTALMLAGMLTNVIEKGHGKRAGVKGYYIAGKTGTAQVPDKEKRGYSDKTIHTFVGFGPTDNPKFVMLVKLDDPKDVRFSASSAAPLFSELANFLLTYWQIPKERD